VGERNEGMGCDGSSGEGWVLLLFVKPNKEEELEQKNKTWKQRKTNVNRVKIIFSRLPGNFCFVSTTRASTLGVRRFFAHVVALSTVSRDKIPSRIAYVNDVIW
jgi:hypothetical protein